MSGMSNGDACNGDGPRTERAYMRGDNKMTEKEVRVTWMTSRGRESGRSKKKKTVVKLV